jgi:predicted permease
MMAKSPGFTAVAILSLALGIGANTAIFTLINNLLLKQLPVRDPQQLVSFGKGDSRGTMDVSSPGSIDIFPYDFYQRIAQRQTFFEGITGFASFPTTVSVRFGSVGNGPATQAITHLVSGTFFSVLGAEPQLGRPISPSDADAPGRSPVAVISHRYWQQALAADPSVIGRTLGINGTPFTIIGVMPEKFYGVDLNEQTPDMWLPLTMQHEVMLQSTLLQPGGLFWINVIARRNPGVSIEQAQAWLTAQLQEYMTERAGAQLTDTRRKNISHMFVPLLPGETGLSHLRSEYQAPLTALMGVVGIVLLIACANLANFLLAKAASREREFSTRLALGSTRGRILRQILTETLLLAFIGGALGLLFAFWGTRLLINFLVGTSAHTALAATPDLHVLAFTSGICILAGLCFGIAPALRISRLNAAGTLSSNARTAASAGGHASRLMPRVLVAA